MQRFWSDVRIDRTANGWTVLLDGRALHTPARSVMAVPTEQLADAIAREWRAVDGAVAPRSMPLTGLCNAAIDITGLAPERVAGALADYARSDLLCYRAETPLALGARQAEIWEPLLRAAEEHLGAGFVRTTGIMPVLQPAGSIDRVAQWFKTRDGWQLAGLQQQVPIMGSALLAIAIDRGAVTAASGFEASVLDETWQAEFYGEDDDAAAHRDARRRDFLAAAQFLALLQG